MYVYLYNYAEIDLKFDSADATWLIGMIGILNTVGEVLVGWLGIIFFQNQGSRIPLNPMKFNLLFNLYFRG